MQPGSEDRRGQQAECPQYARMSAEPRLFPSALSNHPSGTVRSRPSAAEQSACHSWLVHPRPGRKDVRAIWSRTTRAIDIVRVECRGSGAFPAVPLG